MILLCNLIWLPKFPSVFSESINLKRLAFLQTLAGEFVFVLNLELLGDITTHFTAIHV